MSQDRICQKPNVTIRPSDKIELVSGGDDDDKPSQVTLSVICQGMVPSYKALHSCFKAVHPHSQPGPYDWVKFEVRKGVECHSLKAKKS